MNETFDLSTYREALLFLATAGVVAPLFFRLRVSPVLGYLLAGLALGPYGLGALAEKAPWLNAFALSNLDAIGRVAEFGVVVLLFTMGLELPLERLKAMRRLVFGLGLVQVAATTLVLAAIAFALGQPPAAALVAGAALSLSSTAIVIPALAESKRLGATVGRATFSVLLFQDLAVAPLLFMASMLNGGEGRGLGWAFLAALAPAALALGVVIVLGRLVLRPLFRSVAMTQSPEFFMAACLLVVLGAALIAAASGLSMALGAFVAGLLLAETEFRREIEVTIEPFKGLLLGLFFVSVGAQLNVSYVVTRPGLVLGLSAGLILAKAAVVFMAARGFRLPSRVAAEMALLLGPGGEFAFVMIGAALAGAVIDASTGAALLVSVALTMALVPALARLGAWLGARSSALAKAAQAQAPPESEAPRVIIVGYGRVGALIGEMLEVHAIPYIAIDSDASVATKARARGKQVYFGDATRAEYLRRCGVDTARAVVVTMDAPRANETVVEVVRKIRGDVTLIARARDAAHARTLYELGVTDAVPETIEASLQLSEATLVDIGVPMGLVIASIHEKRDEFRKILFAAGAPERPASARQPRRR